MTSESVRLEQEELDIRTLHLLLLMLRLMGVNSLPKVDREELDIRTLHLLRATVHNEERKLPESWEENPSEHKKYALRHCCMVVS